MANKSLQSRLLFFQEQNELNITILSKKRFWIFILLFFPGLFLAALYFVLFRIISIWMSLSFHLNGTEYFFIFPTIIGIIFLQKFVLHEFLWTLYGKEIIHLGIDALSIKNDILGYGRLTKYETQKINNMRILPVSYAINNHCSVEPGDMDLAFDYEGKTLRFALGVNEPEAKEILNQILNKFPQ